VIICVAGGPSYTADQAALVNAAHEAGHHLLVCNRSWEKHPNADVLYGADARFWRAEEYGQRALREFKGECWTCDQTIAREFGLCPIRIDTRGRGLGRGRTDPAFIASGCNGGYQLICKAFRFSRLIEPIQNDDIVLVAYDMQKGPNGENHHHADYVDQVIDGKKVRFTNANGVAKWIKHFDELAADLRAEGVRVINCSAQTALTQFERGDLATVLA